MLPFEFIVDGSPVSQQTRRRSRLPQWRATVRAAAAQRWPTEDLPIERDLTVAITHFYEGAPADVDNLVKPIVDAIKGLAYVDDGQVTDLLIRRRPLRGPYVIAAVSEVLAAGLWLGREFLHIRLANPPTGGELRTI